MLLDERKVAPAEQSEWVAEIKYDGYRVLAQAGGDGAPILRTRNGQDCTRWFDEVVEALKQLTTRRIVVDGEMCVLDEMGRTDFDALQARARRKGWKPGDPTVTFVVFDLLVLDGASIMTEPLTFRKGILGELMSLVPAPLLYARHFDSGHVAQPVSFLYEQAVALQLEGVVAKLADSPYLPGERTSAWFKLKRPGAVPPERFAHKRK
jgi:bifunctional non-homologous end joining protein LigD